MSISCSVGNYLSELQLSKLQQVGYPNSFSKVTHTTFIDKKLALAAQMPDIKCFRAHSTHSMGAEDTG